MTSPATTSHATALPPWVAPAAAAAAALGACAYVAMIDPNHSSAYPQCPTKLLFGIDCPMCGATRAVHSLLRADLVGAADHNLLFVLLVPFALYAFAAWALGRVGHPLPRLQIRSRWLTVPALLLVLAFTVVRNLPSGPFHWLNSGVSF